MFQSENWKKIIDDVSTEVRNIFGKLTAEELNKKPNTDTWSIAQVLDHIIVINESYYPVIDNIRKGDYKAGMLGRQKFMTNFWFKTIYKSIHPDNRKKSKTQAIWQPSTSNIEGEIVIQFVQHQQQLKMFMDACKDLVENNTVIHSPAAIFITYTIGQAFEIIVAHEQRHLLQAKEVLQKIK